MDWNSLKEAYRKNLLKLVKVMKTTTSELEYLVARYDDLTAREFISEFSEILNEFNKQLN